MSNKTVRNIYVEKLDFVYVFILVYIFILTGTLGHIFPLAQNYGALIAVLYIGPMILIGKMSLRPLTRPLWLSALMAGFVVTVSVIAGLETYLWSMYLLIYVLPFMVMSLLAMIPKISFENLELRTLIAEEGRDKHSKNYKVLKIFRWFSAIQMVILFSQITFFFSSSRDIPGSYFDFWAGTFPVKTDYVLATYFCLHSCLELILKKRLWLIWFSVTSAALLYIHAEVVKISWALLVFFTILETSLSMITQTIRIFYAHLIKNSVYLVSLLIMVSIFIWQYDSTIIIIESKTREGSTEPLIYDAGYSRKEALLFLLRGEWSWLGSGPGYDSIPKSLGFEDRSVYIADTPGWLSVYLYELGMIGGILFISASAILMSPAGLGYILAMFPILFINDWTRNSALVFVLIFGARIIGAAQIATYRKQPITPRD